MEPASRKRGGGIFEGLYKVIMRRNSVYVTFVIAGAFVGERESLESKVNETKAMVKFQLKKVLCMGVAVGNCTMEEKQIFQNVQLSVNLLVSLLKKNWQNRMKELEASEPTGDGKMLRLSVKSGGCSAFQYVFNLDDRINSDDRVFERGGIKLVADDISYDFVKGEELNCRLCWGANPFSYRSNRKPQCSWLLQLESFLHGETVVFAGPSCPSTAAQILISVLESYIKL